MKVALVHDDLVQWGGAERVFLSICELFPDAPIYTSLYNKNNSLIRENFQGKKIIASFLQKIYQVTNFYKPLLPLYPIAFEHFDFSDYDLVISSTTRFAKAILTKPNCLHICYTHTPVRFLWNLSDEKINKMFTPYLSFLRFYDQISSKRVDLFLAGSKNAAKRLRKIYKLKSLVCQPFVDDIFFSSNLSFDGNYFLIISRLNAYKKVDLAVRVFNKISYNLKVVGSGPELSSLKKLAKENIDFYQDLDEQSLLSLLAGAKALIIVAEEDFGLTALEAQAMGKPVIAFSKGGIRETVIEGETGIFFDEQSENSLQDALKRFEQNAFISGKCIDNAHKFSKSVFKLKFKKIIEKTYEEHHKTII